MKNLKTEIKKNILTITVDLSKDFGNSKSGKSQVIASSEGNQKIEGTEDIKLGLNIYRPVGG